MRDEFGARRREVELTARGLEAVEVGRRARAAFAPDRSWSPLADAGERGETAGMSDGLTASQRAYRFLWRFMGPAQTGLPPYATPEEREEYRLGNQPRTPALREPPPGYRFMVYTDPNGVPRRALIPIDPGTPTPTPPPEPTGLDGPGR